MEVGVSVGSGEGIDVAVGSGDAVAIGCSSDSDCRGAARDTGGGWESGGLSGPLSGDQQLAAPTERSSAVPAQKVALPYEASLVLPAFDQFPPSNVPCPNTQVLQ